MNSTGTAARSPNPACGDPPGYRLVRRLGQGGYADVWEAEAPGGFRVALKLVRPTVKTRSGELRAIEVIRGIRHPHLLVPFGAWEVDGLLIIAMELADRSLWDRFREAHGQGLRGVPRRQLLGYLTEAASAIDHLNTPCHTMEGRPAVGIQHRDLKPQNILLFGSSAKVADFGMVRVMEQNTASHTGTWTLPYAAPEFFHGTTARQSDQYCLAVTYCQLRGGRLPFWGTAAEVMLGHTSMPPDLERLPEPERPVVARALSKRPEDRWPDCRSFLEALQPLASEVPDTLPGDEPDGLDDYAPVLALSGECPSSLRSIQCPSPPGGLSVSSATGFDRDAAADLFQTNDSDAADGPFVFDGRGWGQTSSSVTRELPVPPPSDLVPPRVDRAPEKREFVPIFVDTGAPPRRPSRALTRYAVLLLSAGATLVVPPVPVRTDPPGPPPLPALVAYQPSAPAPTAEVKGVPKEPPADTETLPSVPPAPEPTPPEPAPEAPAVADAVKPPVDVVTSTVAPEGTTREGPPDDPKDEPLPPAESVPVVAIPGSLSLRAGSKVWVPVRLRGGAADGARSLAFRDLPRGVVVSCPPIDSAEGVGEAVFSAPEDAGPAESLVTVAPAGRPDAPPTQFRLRVLAAPPTAVYNRGRALLTSGQYKLAVAEFNEALRRDPEHAGAYFSRGLAYQLDSHLAEALADYSEAIRRKPDHADARLLRGRVYQERGELGPAASDLTAAIRLQPKNPNAFLARARIYHDLGAYDKSLVDYTEAARLRPDDPTAFYRRGLLRYLMGDFAGAVADHSAAVRLNPKHAKALRARSEAYARLGDKAHAAADREAYLKLCAASRPAPTAGKTVAASR